MQIDFYGFSPRAYLYLILSILSFWANRYKQSIISETVDELCGAMPPELVLAIIGQEGGAGAFYCGGWRYNSFYSQESSS